MRKERINLAERFNWKWVMMVIMAFVLSLPVSAKLCHACPEETYRVNVASGYLALRNAQCYDVSNEIGKLYIVLSLPVSAKLCHACPEETYRVNVASGYLALRNAQCYDVSNEIGKLYNTDTVDVVNYSGTYWYVYSPKYGCNGYVDSRYLVIDSTPSYSYSNTTLS